MMRKPTLQRRERFYTKPVLTPSELHRLQQRYRQLQAEMAQLGWIARGSRLPSPPARDA